VDLIATIFRHPIDDLHQRTSHRQAVRAIIRRGQELLMVYSPVNGDYKFPGGGVKRSEDHDAALRREVLEECGAQLTSVGSAFGKVIEYDLSELPWYDIFKMTSYYYLCEIDGTSQPLHLDGYEADLQFQPAWVEIEQALHTNRQVLGNPDCPHPFWTRRETRVLERLAERWSKIVPTSITE
jgi:8-oxo-dGTP pyrophosphatase MutT (NUDIX family)